MDSISSSIPSILVGIVLMALLMPSLGQESEPALTEKDVQELLLSRMDNIQQQLSAVANAADEMRSEIDAVIHHCQGTYSEICRAQDLNSNPESPKAGKMLLPPSWVPGKRFVADSVNQEGPQQNRLYDELQRKRAVANHLSGLLRGARNVVKQERKRSCSVNLGFPCDTSRYLEMAKMLDYLNTPGSPGKKRSAERRR